MITSAIFLRLGFTKYWNFLWCFSFKQMTSSVNLHDDLIRKYIAYLFSKHKKLMYAPFHYSFSKLYRIQHKIYLFVYLRSRTFPRDQVNYKYFKYLIKQRNFWKSLNSNSVNKKVYLKNYIQFLQTYTSSNTWWNILYKSKFSKSDVKKKLFLIVDKTTSSIKQSKIHTQQFMFSLALLKHQLKFNLQKTTSQASSLKIRIFLTYRRRWLVFKYCLLILKYVLIFALTNSFRSFCKPNIFMVILMPHEFSLTPELLIKFASARLRTNFPVFQVIKFIIRCLNDGVLYHYINGFKLMFSGRFARRGRSRYLWQNFGKVSPSSLKQKLDYALGLVILTNSVCGLKIWISYKTEPTRYVII